MAVRVVIEREVKPGQEDKMNHLMTLARSRTVHCKGYVSGETLRAVDNLSKFLTISSWQSVEDWKAWEKHPDRAKLQAEIAPLLLDKEKCTIYSHY